MKIFLKKVRNFLRALFYSGSGKFCPICGRSFRRFLTQKEAGRSDAVCPYCNSLERHRFAWLFIGRNTDIFNLAGKSFLHIAPEDCFIPAFRRSLESGSYITADLHDSRADVKMDITDIEYPEGSFDALMCSHVLEHVENDRKALSEFYRILKKGGWAILMVPVELEETFEDPAVTDPEKRKEVFGQEDHVRIYGRDFKDRVARAGFATEIIRAGSFCSEDEIMKMGLLKDEEIYYCRKE